MKYLMFLCFGLIGCYTPQKARRGMDKAMSVHPAVAAQFCADNYPATVGKVDTFTLIIDSLVSVECPDSTIITEVVVNHDTIRTVTVKREKVYVNVPAKTVYITKEIIDSAKVAACEERAKWTISVMSKSVQKQTNRKNIWFGVAMVLLAIHVFRIIIKR